MKRTWGGGTRWRIRKNPYAKYWCIHAPLSAGEWIAPARDQKLTVPHGYFSTFEEARAAFAAGPKQKPAPV